MLDLKRTDGKQRGRARLVRLGAQPGKHSIVFRFQNMRGPASAKAHRRAVVAGKEVPASRCRHSIAFLMAIDESFDVASIAAREWMTATSCVPFTGKIDKLNFQAWANADLKDEQRDHPA